jgi:hypothetical protein
VEGGRDGSRLVTDFFAEALDRETCMIKLRSCSLVSSSRLERSCASGMVLAVEDDFLAVLRDRAASEGEGERERFAEVRALSDMFGVG